MTQLLTPRHSQSTLAPTHRGRLTLITLRMRPKEMGISEVACLTRRTPLLQSLDQELQPLAPTPQRLTRLSPRSVQRASCDNLGKDTLSADFPAQHGNRRQGLASCLLPARFSCSRNTGAFEPLFDRNETSRTEGLERR